MNRVYQVYKGLQDAGRDILLPAPPLDHHDSNSNVADPNQFRHGVLDRPDPHKIEDRVKLLAQIEMDAELNDLRQRQIDEQKQRVLAKPSFNNDQENDQQAQQASSEANHGLEREAQHNSDNIPLIIGGEDKDPEARKRRDKVKEVIVFVNDPLTFQIHQNQVV